MNCVDIISRLGYECAPRPNSGARVFSPFTFSDGTHIGVYVEPISRDEVVVTDHGDAFMHLSSQGARITEPRIRWAIQNCAPATVDEGGAIRMVARVEAVGAAVAAVLEASLRISHRQSDWMPSIAQERFTEIVAKELESVAPNRVQRNVMAIGISGHQLEFPLGLKLPDQTTAYIQTIAADAGRLNWGVVQRATGKMVDLQQTGLSPHLRLVVIDDEDNLSEASRAITLLSTNATVLPFSARSEWRHRFAA